ncbi:hypothetical protein [Streptomyces sp. NPDC056670]|uniref:hypothetical protein n=1 Tax=Streptomyces sp. NPDC056670 TaxID=3345904 RepID=UPI003699277D
MNAPASLAEVATRYRQESLNLKYGSPARRTAEAMATWCAETVANRTPDCHEASYATTPFRTLDWVRKCGYQVAITGVGLGAGCTSLIMQRADETVIASIPAVLHWDGERITVEPPGQPVETRT